MKLAYQQLAQHAAKSLASVYLISGDEILLVQEAVDLLRQAAQQKGFSERVRLNFESGSGWGELLHSHAYSMSLFAEQQIIELDLRGAKFKQADSEILQAYAENPAANTLLIIACHKLDAKTEQSRWWKAIEKHGVVVPVWPVTAEQLPQWIMQRANQSQLTITPKAAALLAHQVEGNLLAAAQEIEKLCLLQPQGTLDEDALTDLIADHSRFDIFNLVDSVLSGNAQRSLHILRNLFAEDVEPTLIIWGLTRELNTMAEIHQQLQQGAALASLFGKFRIWEKRQANVRAFLKRCSMTQCWDLLVHAAQIDRIIKGAGIGNVQDELEKLVLGMTGNVIMQ